MIWIFIDILTEPPYIETRDIIIVDLTIIIDVFDIFKVGYTSFKINLPMFILDIVSQITTFLYCGITLIIISELCRGLDYTFYYFKNLVMPNPLLTRIQGLNPVSFLTNLTIIMVLVLLIDILDALTSIKSSHTTIEIPISKALSWAKSWGPTFICCEFVLILISELYICLDYMVYYFKNPLMLKLQIRRIIFSTFIHFRNILIILTGLAILPIILDMLVLIDISYITFENPFSRVIIWAELLVIVFIYCVITIVIIIFIYSWCKYVYNYFIDSKTLINFIKPILIILTIRFIALSALLFFIDPITPIILISHIIIITTITLLPIQAIVSPILIITILTLLVLLVLLSTIFLIVFKLPILILFCITIITLRPFITPLTPIIHVAIYVILALILILNAMLSSTVTLIPIVLVILLILLLLLIINS